MPADELNRIANALGMPEADLQAVAVEPFGAWLDGSPRYPT